MPINGINHQTPQIQTPQGAPQTGGTTQTTKAGGATAPLTIGAAAPVAPSNPASAAPAITPATPPTHTQLGSTIAALSSSKSVFFSAFAILQLLRECAQEERTTARLTRESDLLVEQNAISAEAAKMRQSGWFALGMGIAGAAITGVMSVASSIAGIKALGTKVQMQSDAQLPQLSTQAATSLEAVGTAKTNLDTVKTTIVGEQIQAKQAELGQVPQVTQEQVTQAQTELQQLRDNPPAQLEEPDMAHLTPEQQQKLNDAAGKPNEAEVKAEVTREQNEARTAEHATRVQTAEQNVTQKTQGKAAYDQAQADLHALEENPPTEVDRATLTDDQKTRLETAERGVSDAKETFRMDETRYRAAKDKLEQDPVYLKTEKTIKSADIVQSVSTTLSGLFNSVSSAGTSLFQAASTTQQAMQKEAQSGQQQETDMIQTANELNNTVMQTLQAIYQAETQSFRDIMA